MRTSGRVNWILILIGALLLTVVGIVATSGESPSVVATKFMVALGKGDTETLTNLSYFNPKISKDEVKKKWERTVLIGKHYRYLWKVNSDVRPTPDRATVRMTLMRNLDSGSAYDENFSLDLLRENGQWLVDVRSISRDMYPALPR